MLFRPMVESDLDSVLACVTADPLGTVDADRYRNELALHQYRPEWTWIAEDGDRILACGVWWSLSHRDHPMALDSVHVDESVADPGVLAGDLLTRAHRSYVAAGATELPEWHLNLPIGWTDDPTAVARLAWRRDAADHAGLTDELERRSFEWCPTDGLPDAGTRLTFRPEPDDAVWLDVFARIIDGTLDTITRRNAASMGLAAAAQDDLDCYREMPSPRDWWRLAYDADGALVGFAIPSANPYVAIVGYLGVLPEHRGNGHIDEILAHITHFHAAHNADRIIAATDVINTPMAAAFTRAHYRNTKIRLILSAPKPPAPTD